MDSGSRIEETAEDFWAQVGDAPGFPRDMQAAITLASPLELRSVHDLHVDHVRAWTRRVNLAFSPRGSDRRLHGCLLAWKGKGVIFFDADDPDDEQRFTLAHELAHFLLDHEARRQRAINILGPSILAVLDGERSPTIQERLHAALDSVSLGVMSHLMERPERGLPSNVIIDVENRADRLALELLTPLGTINELLDQPAVPKGFQPRAAFLSQQLAARYGLPEHISTIYARFVLARRGEPTFRNWLFG